MPKRPLDLEAIRRADAHLAQLFAEHPELRAPNPAREAALAAWLQSLDDKEDADGTPADRT